MIHMFIHIFRSRYTILVDKILNSYKNINLINILDLFDPFDSKACEFEC